MCRKLVQTWWHADNNPMLTHRRLFSRVNVAILTVLILCCQLSAIGQGQTSSKKIQSPDKRISVSFFYNETSKNRLSYSVSFDNKPVLLESALELKLDNHLSQLALALPTDQNKKWSEYFVFKTSRESTHDSEWIPPYGE